MSSVKFLQFVSRVPKVPTINGNPFVEGEFACPVSRKKQQVRISTIRKCLEDGNPEAVVKFVERVPIYMPYVVAALIDQDESVAFNAEWCVRRLACTSNKLMQVLLAHSLAGFLNSPWVLEGKKANDPRALELSKEIREVYDFISN
jgi:hypothetical protein